MVARDVRFAPPLGLELSSRFESGQESHTHYECRDCGKNLPSEPSSCPQCGGEVVVYEW